MQNFSLSRQVDDYILFQMREQSIPGLSLAVIAQQEVLKMEGYGVANVELAVPAEAKTVYNNVLPFVCRTGLRASQRDLILSANEPVMPEYNHKRNGFSSPKSLSSQKVIPFMFLPPECKW